MADDYSPDELEKMIVVVNNIQAEVGQLAKEYSCYNYKVIYMYTQPSEKILELIIENKDKEITELVDQLVTFLADNDVDVLKAETVYNDVCELCELLKLPIPITYPDLCDRVWDAIDAYWLG